MKRILFFLMICLSLFSHKETNAQCDNLALAFDNLNPNFVSLNPSPITGATDFTIEATFYANNLGTACLGDFRPLLSLNNPNNSHSFELGICNGGQLHFFWFNGSPAFPLSPIPISSTNLTGAWHLSLIHILAETNWPCCPFILSDSSKTSPFFPPGR